MIAFAERLSLVVFFGGFQLHNFASRLVQERYITGDLRWGFGCLVVFVERLEVTAMAMAGCVMSKLADVIVNALPRDCVAVVSLRHGTDRHFELPVAGLRKEHLMAAWRLTTMEK